MVRHDLMRCLKLNFKYLKVEAQMMLPKDYVAGMWKDPL